MKKVGVVASTVLALAGGTGAVAMAAQGASAAPVHQYAHGGGRMTHFTSWQACQGYAAATARTVMLSGGKIMAGSGDNGNRVKCFPMSNGQWTYVTAYTAPHAIHSNDYNLDLHNGGYVGDSLLMFDHRVTAPAKTFTAAKCAAENNAFTRRVVSGAQVRLLPSPGCSYNAKAGTRSYAVYYLGTSLKAGLSGDRSAVTPPWDLSSEIYELGYHMQAK